MRKGELHVSWGSNTPYVLSLIGGVIICATLISFNTPWYVQAIAAVLWFWLIGRPTRSPRDVTMAWKVIDSEGKVVLQNILYANTNPKLPGENLSEDWGDHPYITSAYARSVQWCKNGGDIIWATIPTWPLTRRYTRAFWLSAAHIPLWCIAFNGLGRPEPSLFLACVPALALYIIFSARENHLPSELDIDLSEVQN